MNIDRQLIELQEWTIKNNILLVEGECDVEKFPNIYINSNSENPVEELKKIILHLGVKVVIYTSIIFDKETFSQFEKVSNLTDDEEIKDKFKKLKSFENKYFGITTYIFSEGITYTFRNYIKETSDYLEVLDFVNEFEEENDDDNYEENKSIYKDLSDEKLSEFKINLAENKIYQKLKYNSQKIDFASELFKKELSDLSVEPYYGASKIVSKADLYFEIKVKPKLEIEIRQKVKELLNSGMTKVKIASELGLSKDALNKFV